MTGEESSRGWRIGTREGLGADHAAAWLATLDLDAPLAYRDVLLTPCVDDVIRPPGEALGTHYRVFTVRVLRWPAVKLPQPLLERWRSVVVLMPAYRPKDPWACLSELEAEFVARSMVERIGSDIDDVLRRGPPRRRVAGPEPRTSLPRMPAEFAGKRGSAAYRID